MSATPTPSAIYRKHDETVDYTPVADSLAGDVVLLADGRAAVLKTDILNGIVGSAYVEGQVDAVCASGVTFTDGEAVWWDATNKTAINQGSAVVGTDYPLGNARGAKSGTGLTVRVALNETARTASADQAVITDSTGGTKATTFAAITAPAANATTSLTADMTAVKNALSQIAATLNAHRTALLANRIEKGAA